MLNACPMEWAVLPAFVCKDLLDPDVSHNRHVHRIHAKMEEYARLQVLVTDAIAKWDFLALIVKQVRRKLDIRLIELFSS